MLLPLGLMGTLIVANPASIVVMVDISSRCASEAEAIDFRPAADLAIPGEFPLLDTSKAGPVYVVEMPCLWMYQFKKKIFTI